MNLFKDRIKTEERHGGYLQQQQQTFSFNIKHENGYEGDEEN